MPLQPGSAPARTSGANVEESTLPSRFGPAALALIVASDETLLVVDPDRTHRKGGWREPTLSSFCRNSFFLSTYAAPLRR
jgi:hypothetical protein